MGRAGDGGGCGAEVFVRLGGQEKVPGNVRAWLLVSVRRAALDALKMAGRRRERERRAGEGSGRGCSRRRAASGREEWRADPRPGMRGWVRGRGGLRRRSKLPGVEREIVTLRIWSGATFEEIGAVMGMAVSSVHTKYRSGLEMLRAGWERDAGRYEWRVGRRCGWWRGGVELTGRERELEWALGTMVPAGVGISRDEVMFGAGRAAGEARPAAGVAVAGGVRGGGDGVRGIVGDSAGADGGAGGSGAREWVGDCGNGGWA